MSTLNSRLAPLGLRECLLPYDRDTASVKSAETPIAAIEVTRGLRIINRGVVSSHVMESIKGIKSRRKSRPDRAMFSKCSPTDFSS